MKHLKLFETDRPIEQGFYVSYTKDDDLVRVIDNQHDYSKDYLTFVALNEGTFIFNGISNEETTNKISYKINDNEWSEWANSVEINVQTNDVVMWKGINMMPSYKDGIGNFTLSTALFDIQGNIMSLLYGDNYTNQNSLDGTEYIFSSLFQDSNAVNAQNLSLPATTLGIRCYRSMFSGCTSLISTPSLPATTLASGCYIGMFENCTSLTKAPKLYATTLKGGCYQVMFANCNSLSNTPELRATIMEDYCYMGMFMNCTNLTKTTKLPSTTLADSCYDSMFQGCISLTDAPKLQATTLAKNCYKQMFADCTSLAKAPQLPSTTLAEGCYFSMFYGCTSLNEAPQLPSTTLAESCYKQMFYQCTNLKLAPKLLTKILVPYCYQFMFDGCTTLNKITMLAIDISAISCLYKWVNNVAENGTFVKDASMTTLPNGENGIPNGWVIQNE